VARGALNLAAAASAPPPPRRLPDQRGREGGGWDRNRRTAGERLAEESRRGGRTSQGRRRRRRGAEVARLNETGLDEEGEGAERAAGRPEMGGGAPRRPRLLLLSARRLLP